MPDCVKLPCVPTVLVVASVRPRTFSSKVCVPVAPPTVRLLIDGLTSSVTVYVPGSVMKTLSPAIGTRFMPVPSCQFAALFQLPPDALIQLTSVADKVVTV